MEKRYLIITLLTLIFLASFPEIIGVETNSFTVISYPVTRVFDPGDEVILHIIIAGYGDIEQSKMKVLIPPDIVDGNVILNRVKFEYDPVKDCYNPIGYEDPFQLPHNLAFNISLWKFKEEPCPVKGQIGGLSILSEGTYGPTWEEIGGPFYITFKIPKSSPKGDHSIESAFTYYTGNQWITTRSATTIHIRGFLEKHEKLITTFLSFLGVLITSFTGIIAWRQWHSREKK